MKKILLHAYGNPGRGDDGLGNEFITNMERWIADAGITNVATESSYQLNIEDAAAIADFDITIFVDASRADGEPFLFAPIQPNPAQSFTTHSVSPASLLALCRELYGRTPLVYLLQIKGYHWEFGEGLSPEAAQNLEKSLIFAKSAIAGFQNQE